MKLLQRCHDTSTVLSGKRKCGAGHALSDQVGVELIDWSYGERVYFVVYGETAALPTPGKRTFDDDLIPIMDLDSAGHFEDAIAVGQQKLERRFTFLIDDQLNILYQTNDHYSLMVIHLGMGHEISHLEQVGAGKGYEQKTNEGNQRSRESAPHMN
jgi:hypothetical protein